MYLADFPVGQLGKIVGLNSKNKSYRKKLLAMGLTPGVQFSIIRFAPLGDPIELEIRGYSLSLRKAECKEVLVEPLYSV